MKRACALATALIAAPAAADGIRLMCDESGGSEAVCACAAQALAGEVGRDDYARYRRIGWDYGLLRARGTGDDDAWRSAVRAEAARRAEDPAVISDRADGIARAHRAEIRRCRLRNG